MCTLCRIMAHVQQLGAHTLSCPLLKKAACFVHTNECFELEMPELENNPLIKVQLFTDN